MGKPVELDAMFQRDFNFSLLNFACVLLKFKLFFVETVRYLVLVDLGIQVSLDATSQRD